MSTLAALQQEFQSYVLQGEPDVVKAREHGGRHREAVIIAGVELKCARAGGLHGERVSVQRVFEARGREQRADSVEAIALFVPENSDAPEERGSRQPGGDHRQRGNGIGALLAVHLEAARGLPFHLVGEVKADAPKQSGDRLIGVAGVESDPLHGAPTDPGQRQQVPQRGPVSGNHHLLP